MANTIQLKRSSVASKVPTTAQLSLGELALNTFDGKLYTKRDQNGTAAIVDLSISDSPIVETSQTISSDQTIQTGFNAASFGNVEIANGITVEIPNNSTWGIY